MKFRNKVKILSYLLKARWQRINNPLAVRWNITNRCTSKCIYCDIGNIFLKYQSSDELKSERIISILAQMAKCGTIRVSFSGGEPMLREDIGEIVDYCDRVGMGAEMNSSGKLMSIRYNELKKLSLLKLSLDGPEGIHELTRCGVKFREVIDAADTCAKCNIKFAFCTTITKYNVRHLKTMHDIAKFYNTIVAFQPLEYLPSGSDSIRNCYPPYEDFKDAIAMLIKEKKRGSKYIRNSLIGLKYIYNWPEYDKLRCWAGRVFCVIGSDGTVFPCDRLKYNSKLPNCDESGFREAFNKLPIIKECSGCGFCGTLELNSLMAYKFLSATDPIRKYV